jgi:ABC-type lipoprotein export system ATPase subunit
MDDQQLAAFRNRQIGFVFQSHHLLPQCTAVENVLIPTLAGQRDPDAPRRAEQLLERVGLADRMHHTPGKMSGGERQRVAVVRALINRPRMLLADEPTGSLDRAASEGLAKLIVELNQQDGLTVIVVTHSRELAASMGKVLSLRDGQVVNQGDAS